MARSRRDWLPRLGMGMVAAGVVLDVAAGMTPVQPGRDEFPVLALAGLTAVLLVLVVLVGISVRMWRYPGAARGSFALRRRWSVAGSVLAVALAGYAWWQVLVEVDGGLLSLALPLFAVGATLLAIGCVLLALAPRNPAPVRRVTDAWVVATTALLVGVVATAGAVAVERSPVDATTTSRSEPAPLVGAPERVAWQWETPTGERLSWDSVVATPNGVAVLVNDGVVALDARTGEELWHYRVSGAQARNIGASPSGAWVMVQFASGNDDGGGHQVIAFDGETGEIGFDDVGDVDGTFGNVILDLTDHVLVGGTPSEGSLRGFALETGDRLWNWELPETCGWRPDTGSGYVAAGATVIITLICGDENDMTGDATEVVFIGLDSLSGAEAWRYTFSVADQAGRGVADLPGKSSVLAEPLLSVDGAVAQLWWGNLHESGFGSVVVDTETGDELLAAELNLGVADRVDASGLASYADGRFVLTSYGDGEPMSVSPGCDSPAWASGAYGAWVGGAEAIVQLCVPEDHGAGEPVTFSVTPWDTSNEPYEFEVDLGAPAGDAFYDPPFLVTTFPAVIVAIADGGTRLTALG